MKKHLNFTSLICYYNVQFVSIFLKQPDLKPCLSFHDILTPICTKLNERGIKLLCFRSIGGTGVGGGLIRRCSFSLHCTYL